MTLEAIEHNYILVQQEAYKLDCLADLYEHISQQGQTIIFCNTKRKGMKGREEGMSRWEYKGWGGKWEWEWEGGRGEENV